MQVTVNKSLQLDTPVQNVWTLFRDVDRFARLVPGVTDIQVEKEGDQEKYIARLVDKVGPFKIEMTVEIKLVQMVTDQLLEAQLTGFDRGGKNRLKGNLQAELSQLENDKTQVEFSANIEVLVDWPVWVLHRYAVERISTSPNSLDASNSSFHLSDQGVLAGKM